MSNPAVNDPIFQARMLYAQARACHVLALVFAVCGFFVFAALLQSYVMPDLFAALRRASTLGIMIFPFLPAIGLSLVARRFEKRYLALMEKQ